MGVRISGRVLEMALFSKPSEWLYHEGTCHGVGHTWSTSCLYSSAEVFCFVAWEGFKIYLPIYIVMHCSSFHCNTTHSLLTDC